jgi:hypothetical protein
MGVMRSAYTALVGKPEWRISLGRPGLHGKKILH